MVCVHISILPENLHFDKYPNLKPAHFASAVDSQQHDTCMSCVYRSILPENLHFDKDLNLKLAHFASAVDMDQGPAPCTSACVVDYLAPEVISHCFIHASSMPNASLH